MAGADAADVAHLRAACRLALQCAPVASAYNVGALVVAADGATVLAGGFSRELPGNTHAEEVALARAAAAGDDARARLRGATLYTSMEPCSERLSGKAPCVRRILDAGIARVVLAIREPPHFVAACAGVAQLRAAGVEVVAADSDECAELARRANAHIGGGSGGGGGGGAPAAPGHATASDDEVLAV